MTMCHVTSQKGLGVWMLPVFKVKGANENRILAAKRAICFLSAANWQYGEVFCSFLDFLLPKCNDLLGLMSPTKTDV